jgi:hypothetical protein
MSRADWITIAVLLAGLLILIKSQRLKTWPVVVIFGAGFYFATTTAGQYLMNHVTSLITQLTH